MFQSIFIKSLLLFLSFLTIAAATQAQGQHNLYKGQYHRGKTKSNISIKNITKNELLTLYITGGLATYNGDLTKTFQGHSFRPQLGGGAMLRTLYFGKRLNLRADIRCFRLYSNDVFETRNLDFRSTNWEFLALGQFDLFPYEKLMRRRSKINPYAYAGIGLMTFDPWGQLSNGKWHKLRPLETEHVKYGNVTFVYTIGMGFKYSHSYRWNFMFEAGYRFTMTDYLDDVKGPYYPPGNSFDNSISKYMSNKSNRQSDTKALTGRGSGKHNDGYVIVSVGVTYTFTKHHARRVTRGGSLLRK